jgi:hypothetical protein
MGDDLEGLSDQEIAARTLETKLEGIMQSRQWLLAQRRVYEGNRNTAEQDAIAVIENAGGIRPRAQAALCPHPQSANPRSVKEAFGAPGFQVR